MKRTASPLRKTRVRPVNRKRRAKERLRAYGPPARRAWVASLPCGVHPVWHGLCDAGPRDNAHIESGGAGRKADSDTVIPLCRRHHETLHRVGRVSFERRYGVDLAALAAATELAWRDYESARSAVQ